jgi:hypothetical protein
VLDTRAFHAAREIGLPLVPLTRRSRAELFGAASPGVHALALAVFEEGVRDYVSRDGRVRADAEAWVQRRGGESPFAFDQVCELLGLAPDAVRRTLATMRTAQLTERKRGPRVRPNARGRARRIA